MSFTSKVSNYTNSVSNETLPDALSKGLDYTLGIVKAMNPDMLRLFAYEISTGTNTVQGLDWEKTWNISYLIDVKKSTKFCRPVSDRLAEDLVDTSSIYYALVNDPVYYLEGDGSLTVKPVPTPNIGGTSGNCKLFGVPNSNGRTIHDGNETITINSWGANGISYVSVPDKHFPVIFKELIILHAAECILMERLADFRTVIPTGLDAEWADALAKAKKLFDDGAGIQGDNAGASMSVQYWLSDEDEDMAGTTLQAIGSEIQRANSYALKFKTDIEKISLDYQWTQGQLQMLGQKKQEFIQSNIQIGPVGSPDEEKKI